MTTTTQGSSTTYFVNNYYKATDGIVTKHYYAGSQRIAMRKDGVLSYILGDHLGSTSVTTDNTGAKVSEMRYKPFGELRYSWTNAPVTSPSYALSKYTFTGQYSYMDDPSTAGVSEGFGLMYYNARMYDPALGRFTSADTIIPGAGDSSAWDRYAYTLNNPLRYTDPTGHMCSDPEDPTSNCDGADHLGQVSHGGGSELPLIPYNGPCVSVMCLPTSTPRPTVVTAQPNLSLLVNPPPSTCDAYCQSQLGQSTQTPVPSNLPGTAVQIEYLIYSYIKDINYSSPLFWRKTFTAGKAINPFPVVDAVVGAVGQGLTDAFNPNLSLYQRGERIGLAGVESGLTGVASDGIGFGVGLAGGGPVGYAAAQVVSSVAIDNGFWANYNHKYFGAAGY